MKLPTNITVRRLVHAADGQGGQIEGWADIQTTKGRFSLNSPRVRMSAGQEQGVGSYTLFVLTGLAIELNDRVWDGEKEWELVAEPEHPSNSPYLQIQVQRVVNNG